VELAIN